MMNLLVSFALDIALASLLLVTIVYCWKLNGRIRVLQDSRGELSHLIRKFDETTERASQTIAELQATGRKINESIAQKIEKANFIADDLSYMIDRGAKLADNMENAITTSRRPAAPPARPGVTSAVAKPQGAPAYHQPAARHAMPTFKSQPAATPTPAASKTSLQEKLSSASTQTKATATLESVLERISGSSPENTISTFEELSNKGAAMPKRQPSSGSGTPSVRMRSKAEQELFEALKGGR